MLKRRLIPKLLLRPGKVGGRERMVLVTTIKYDKTIEVGDPVSQAKIYEAQAVDELIFLDIAATPETRPLTLDVIRKAAAETFMPVTVGGGVKSVEDFRLWLSNGADKIAINTAAVEEPDLIPRASDRFGAQCVVVSIDCRGDAERGWTVWTRNGSRDTGLDPAAWAAEAQRRGAGEILISSIDRDGSSQGLDLALTKSVTDAVTIPVIASGGCGLAAHFIAGFRDAEADAVSAGTFFCFKDQNPMQTRSHIRNAGIPVRLHQ